MRRNPSLIVACFGLALAAPACGGSSGKKSGTPLPASASGGPASRARPTVDPQVAPEAGATVQAGDAARFDPIYFEFDSAELATASRDTLVALAKHLERNPGVTVTVAGHCDERGPPEYNIALGDRRARVAVEYLVRLGVSPSRARPKSYGEEQPAVDGEGEDAWSRNRRDEFNLSGDGRRTER